MSYFGDFLSVLSKGSAERRTLTATGDEAVFQDGILAAATDPSLDYSAADIVESIAAEPHLVMFGAGHIGKALHDLGSLQSMRMTVLDDRPELLTAERFPHAERHIAPYPELLKRSYDSFPPYFIIFTHGHSFDQDCLRYTLSRPAAYIGMIGSRAKSQRALEEMRKEGFPEERIKEVRTPIGLPIGAETPEEIAISIMAEIISAFRRERHAAVVDPAFLSEIMDLEGIAVRIIEKHGSAPREEGSMMFVTDDSVYGTVGGGSIELEAICEARKMLSDGRISEMKRYDLSSEGNLGMVCGGNETLLFRRF